MPRPPPPACHICIWLERSVKMRAFWRCSKIHSAPPDQGCCWWWWCVWVEWRQGVQYCEVSALTAGLKSLGRRGWEQGYVKKKKKRRKIMFGATRRTLMLPFLRGFQRHRPTVLPVPSGSKHHSFKYIWIQGREIIGAQRGAPSSWEWESASRAVFVQLRMF